MGGDHHREWNYGFLETIYPWRPASRRQRLFPTHHSRHHGGKMNAASSVERQVGFTLVELLVALGIFLVITGAAFTLLGTSQKNYQTESQVLASFQEARLGLDQIVRDVNDAGYPPPTFFASIAPQNSASSPFAWSPGYSATSCAIGTGVGVQCTVPS